MNGMQPPEGRSRTGRTAVSQADCPADTGQDRSEVAENDRRPLPALESVESSETERPLQYPGPLIRLQP